MDQISKDQGKPIRPTINPQAPTSIKSKPGFFRRLFSSNSINQSTLPETRRHESQEEPIELNSDSLRHKASILFRRPATTGSIVKRPQSKQENKHPGQESLVRNSIPSHPESASKLPTTNTQGVQAFQSQTVPQPDLLQKINTNIPTTTPHLDSKSEGGPIESEDSSNKQLMKASTSIQLGTAPSATKVLSDQVSLRESQRAEAPILPLVPDHSSPLGSFDLSQHMKGDNTFEHDTYVKAPIEVQTRSLSTFSALQDSPILGTLGDFDLPTEYLVKASAMYEWQDLTMAPEDYAMFLGKEELYNEGIREAYLSLFDFTGMSILNALRLFCSKLYIKGETQVLDRLIEGFSRRWRICNVTEKYLTQDVTYIIAFSLITLNTDIYVANLEKDQRMRRLAFIQNTMRAIRSGSRSHSYDSEIPAWQSPKLGTPTSDLTQEQTIRFVPRSSSLNSFDVIPPGFDRKHSEELVTAQTILSQTPPESSPKPPSLSRKLSRKSGSSHSDDKAVALAFQSRDVYFREILSDMYLSIKNEQIRQPQFRGTPRLSNVESSISSAKSSMKDGLLNAGSDNRFLGSSGNASISSNQSAAERSPGMSTASTFLGRSSSKIYSSQQESRLSVIARPSPSPNSGTSFQRGIGFAGSLNNVIIREEQTAPTQNQDDIARVVEEAEEDILTLHGAPFAKEGRVKLKSNETVPSRKSKYKNWSSELFAVLERGQVRLFDFSLKAIRNTQTTFGGGDWTQNARSVLDITLVQTIASAIPTKRISRDRPFVWALTMANGDEHLFEVGTSELVQEWVSTANYWAARTTREPLLGAVGNADYGWGRCLENVLSPDDVLSERECHSEGTGARTRSSISGESFRTNRTSVSGIGAGLRADSRSTECTDRYPGNQAHIHDWQPDPPPILISNLSQESQLAALERFIKKLGNELEVHNSKRPLILQAFSLRHPNQIRALANFDRRREYLGRELKRYKLYIGALRHGIKTAREVQNEPEREKEEL